jgi:hypothetical protein
MVDGTLLFLLFKKKFMAVQITIVLPSLCQKNLDTNPKTI